MSMKLASVLVTAFAVAMAGCAKDYVTDSEAPVLFKITDINGGAAVESDVLKAGGIFPDNVEVTVAVRSKNPNFSTVPQVAMAVFVTRYEVSFVRSDGRHQEGQDVPYTISGNLNVAVDVATSGGVVIPIEIVRRQAKLEPPLMNLVGGNGAILITCFADIKLHGETTAGQAVTASGRVQVDFGDFVDE